ncbi:MAG TPA: hypothetical protein VJZ04_00185 [Lachnospiraceae bacterium]|nr:hypothetical protein [Lachnospiraceae bacterium]
MLKSKMGISIALVSATMFFLGAITTIPALLLAAYVLIREDNEWLRKTAAKMVGVIVFFGLCSLGVSLINEFFSLINIIIHWFDQYATYVSVPANLTSFCYSIISITENVLLIVMGFKALSMKYVKIKLLDNLIDKFM